MPSKKYSTSIEEGEREYERQKKILQLEIITDIIRKNLILRKRPLIIEFTGLPKSGKTTVINSLSLFLRRNNIPPCVINEKASICPIKNKQIPEFNIWTGNITLAELIRYRYDNTFPVIIVDRGIFDTLTWINFMLKNNQITKDNFDRIEAYFLTKKWTNYIDLIIYMYSTIDKALEREYKDLLTNKPGSIMNEDVLGKFLSVGEECIKKYNESFNIEKIDTSNISILETVEKVTSFVVKSFLELTDETIVVIPKNKIINRLNIAGFTQDRKKIKILERFIKKNTKILKRSNAEDNPNVLQIIACATIKYEGKIALFTKNEINKYERLHNKNMIWVGGHLHKSDLNNFDKSTVLKALKKCLFREIQEELKIDIPLKKTKLKGIVYDNTHRKSLIHLGVLFQIELKNKNTFEQLNLQTIPELSGQSNKIEFIPIEREEFKKRIDALEPWSIDILKKLYNINLSRERKPNQRVLF